MSAAALTCLGPSSSAAADVRVEVGGGGAAASGSVDSGMLSLAAGVAVPVTETVEVGAQGYLGSSLGLDGNMAALTGAGRYLLPQLGWLQPSLAGGAGWYRVESCGVLSGCDPARNGFGFNVGGGIAVPVYQDWVSLGLDARWHHAFVGGFDAGTALVNLGLRL